MRALAPADELDIIASQQHGALERTGLTVDQARAAAWTVADGLEPCVVGGARAIAVAMAVGRGAGWPLMALRLGAVTWLADRVYLLVARHRYRLPGTTPWCEQHPGECVPSED